MESYEKFKLTEQDIHIGIDNFFTQLLVEARRQKTDASTLDDLSSKTPKISYIIGQPGAGKTSLSNYIKRQTNEKGECVVEVGADKIATFHRDYEELVKLLPDECYVISRQFVKPAHGIIYQKIRDKKINLIRENVFNKGEQDYKSMKEFKDSGYEIEVNIIAVDKYESFLSCIERDIKLLELGYDIRPVSRTNHDKMYEVFFEELTEMNNRGLCQKFNVYTRGKSVKQPHLAYTTGDTKYSSAQEAIISERMLQRRIIMKQPEEYLKRILEDRKQIETMIQDEEMKNNYINELNQLEKEFINELSCEKLYE